MKIFLVLAGAALLSGCGGHGGGFNPYAGSYYRYPDPEPFVGVGDHDTFSIVPTGIRGYVRVVGHGDEYESGPLRVGHEALDRLVCARYNHCSGINPTPYRRSSRYYRY